MTWSVVPIGTAARVVSGATPSTSCPEYWGGSICWATPKDISELNGSKFLDDTPRKLTEAGLRSCSAEVLPPNSVLFSSRAPIGLVAINRVPTATNQGFKSFVPDPSKLDTGYLFHWLRAHRAQIERMGVGATFSEVSKAIVSRIEIPLPPIDEQQRIAATLDKADDLRAKRRAALALLDQLPQSIFLEMFGDPAINSRGWTLVHLGDLARRKPNNGIFRKNPEYLRSDSEGLPVVWVEELFRQHPIDVTGSRRVMPTAGEVDKYGLEFGDLLFCRSSLKFDGIAFNNVYLGPSRSALFECHLIRISPDLSRVNPVFLNEMLRLASMRERLKSRAKTATMTTIDQAGLEATIVALPPLELQTQFSDRVQAIHRAKAAHQSALAESEALFSSLLDSVFGGQA